VCAPCHLRRWRRRKQKIEKMKTRGGELYTEGRRRSKRRKSRKKGKV
jgi:hypothetical protein